MAPTLSTILVGALAAMPAINAASVTTPQRRVDSSPGYVSFPIKRSERSSKTLSGRQATASLVNEQETSYTIELAFGSDAQPVHVAIDTGSDELFVDPNCNDSSLVNSQMRECDAEGFYNPDTSTSANATGETSSITYGSGAVDLSYYVDAIGIPGASKNLTAVQFGKATMSEGLSEGILGLGFGEGINLQYPNFVDELQSQGVTNTKAFSVALGTSDSDGGTVVFGGVDTKKFSGALASMAIASPIRGDIQRYAVTLNSIGYNSGSGSTKLYDDSTLSGVVLDTGSSLCELPASVVADMAADLGAEEQQGLYYLDCSAATSDNKMEFAFSGVTIAVPLDQFVLQSGNDCVLGVQALQTGSGITALLGDTFLRNAVVVFDQDNMQISMAQYAECGTNVQAIAAGSGGASGFTGECSTSSSSSSASNSTSAGVADASKPAAGAMFALVASLVALLGLF